MKILFTVVGLFFCHYIFAQTTETKSNYISNQAVIVLKDSSKLENVLNELKNNYKILLAQGSIIIKPKLEKKLVTYQNN